MTDTGDIVYVAVPAAALNRLTALAGRADDILNHLPALHDPAQTQTLIHVRDVIRHELTWTRPHDEDAERIVRELAASEEPVADIWPEYGDVVCMTCPEDSEHFDSFDDVTHDESCPWRRAREWVQAHPVGDET